MIVTLTTTGGWVAGLGLPTRTLDTADLPGPAARELGELLSRVRSASSSEPTGQVDPVDPAVRRVRVPDAASHVVTVQDATGDTELRATDATMTQDFADLLAWIQDRT